MIGSWLDDYVKRATNKYNAGKMSKEKYDMTVAFANQRKIDTKEKFEKYEALSDVELIIQKCVKYIDYEKCGDDTKCYDHIQVKY